MPNWDLDVKKRGGKKFTFTSNQKPKGTNERDEKIHVNFQLDSREHERVKKLQKKSFEKLTKFK